MELVELIFKTGISVAQYYSLFDRILKLPEETIVYPAHDYSGKKFSTVGEQKKITQDYKLNSCLEEYAKYYEIT